MKTVNNASGAINLNDFKKKDINLRENVHCPKIFQVLYHNGLGIRKKKYDTRHFYYHIKLI